LFYSYLISRGVKRFSFFQQINQLLSVITFDKSIIMMDHQPTEIKQAEKSGVDLLLSRHTRRGQMAPNHLVTKKMYDLGWRYRKFNKLHAIVSSGFGFRGPPIRIGSRSEIV
jgi:uncharacterized protein